MKEHCIFMVVNDSFVQGAIITLYSFLKNNTWYDGDIIIGCGSDSGWGLSEENKEKLSNLYYKTQIVELSFSDFYDIFENLTPISQGGMGFEMTVYKFHAFRLGDYEKVFVFDADMLVVGDISELFEQDIKFGALYNVANEDFASDTFKRRNDEYFNVGVMVIGKEYLNEGTIIRCDEILKTGEIFEEIGIPHYKGLYPEQDILNVLTKDKEVTMIPRAFGAHRFYCDENEYKNVKIIHYVSYLKPWRVYDGEFQYEGWTQDEWKKYYEDYNDWLENYTLGLIDVNIKFPKHYEDKDKYMVVTCAKNETPYIREWVQHYLDLDFDKIIICDNNDFDDNSLSEVIADYIAQGFVEVFDCRGFKFFQSHIMSMFCKEGHYKWCGFFDCDEFLEINTFKSIKKYLENKTEECIAFNWVMFDSNGEMTYKDLPLQERFKQPYYPLTNMENSFVKGIMCGGHFRYADIENCGGHLFRCKNKNKITYNFGGYYPIQLDNDNLQSMLPLRYKEGYIKHYYTKSFEEWSKKAQRGWPDKDGGLWMGRFFKLYNQEKYQRERYRETLFIDKTTFEKLSDDIESNDNTEFFIFENVSDYVYAFAVRVMRVMYNRQNRVFILYGKEVTDDVFNLLLECAFVTENKLAIAKSEEEIQEIFKKYKTKDEITYWRKTI